MRSRFALFFATVLGIWAVVHLYVFWRLSSIPLIAAHVSGREMTLIAIALWASYPAARILNANHLQWLGQPIELIAANWVGVVFITFCVLLATDVLTLGGWPFPAYSSQIHLWALLVAIGLSAIGLFQGFRQPVIRNYEVWLQGLPPERDGMSLVGLSDIHLNGTLSRSRLQKLVARVNSLRPDIIVAVGDVVDGEAEHLRSLAPVFNQLRAPLGVWAVTGNHEYYAGIDRSVHFLENAGCTVLRDRSTEVTPGLALAGVDDLGARQQFDISTAQAVMKAFANRPAGATIFLSHTPVGAEAAAANGAGLMLCGHTHNGQIWPFNYLVKARFPLIGGRYEISNMPVIVCRGTGTWGPRMRLWLPSEIIRVTFRGGSREKELNQ